MQNISSTQASAEVPINENFALLEFLQVYGKKASTTSGRVWSYWGGRWGGVVVADTTLAQFAQNSTNYLVVEYTTGLLTASTDNTNWNNSANYARVYKLTTGANTITAIEDHRAGPGGVHGSRIV